MRKFHVFLSVVLALCAMSCTVEQIDESVAALQLSASEISASCKGGIYPLVVKSNTDWTVETIGDGITVDITEGNGEQTINIAVESNDAEEQTSLVKITSKGKSPLTSLCQVVREAYPTIALDRSASTVGYGGATFYLALASNKNWTAVCDADYIAVEPSSGTGNSDITVTVAPNAVTADREAMIVFATEYDIVESVTLRLSQTARSYVTPANGTIDVGCGGGRFDVAVSSNIEWQIDAIEAKTDFVDVVRNGDVLIVTVEVNDGVARSASIGLSTAEEMPQTAQIVVRQAPLPKISLSTTTIDAPLRGGVFKLSLSSTTDWNASVSGGLDITVSPTTGTLDAEITVTVAAGNDGVSTVLFSTADDATVNATLTVRQSSTPMLALNPATINTSTDAATECTVALTSNTAWSVSSKSGGVASVTPASGDGDATLTIALTANDGDAATETITLATTDNSKQATVTVNRPAALALSVTALDYDYSGGDRDIVITTSRNWTITSSDADMSFSAVSGAGNATVKATMTENGGTADRKGSFTVAVDKKTLLVGYTQHRPQFVYGGATYYFARLKDGRWWMCDNLRYVPSGMSPSSNPDAESGIWYPYTDYVNTVYQLDDEGKQVKDENDKPIVVTPASWRVLTDAESVTRYGYFYDAATAFGRTLTADNYTSLEGVRGICPEGWHIPTLAEAEALKAAYARADDRKTYIPDLTADGFVFLPAGMRQKNYGSEGVYSTQISEFFTLSTGASYNAERAQATMKGIILNGTNQQMVIANQVAVHGGHLRCIKDN